jgi:hypothetical protein
MVNDPADPANPERLCFLASCQLTGPLLERADVWTRAGRRLGTFEGVVIDPSCERARYIVVDGGRLVPDWRLIPLPAQLDVVHQALCVEVDESQPTQWVKFNPSRFRHFRPNDESTAMWRPETT